MKKTIYLSLIASLFTTLVSAADLYVRDLGAGGAFTTITAAINAAADGDRIIIRRKAVGSSYTENLVINKSLTFISENNFEKYLVQGTVSITPLAGRVVSINNIELLSNITVSAATTGGRTTLNVMNCIVNNVFAQQPNTTLNISGSLFTSTQLTHGKVTKNTCNYIDVAGTSNETSLATEDIEIIANAMGSNTNQTTLNSIFYNLKFYNNYCSGQIGIRYMKDSSTCEIFNNTILGGAFPPLYIDVSGGTGSAINISNNILSKNSSSEKHIFRTPTSLNSTNPIINAYNNLASGSTFDTSPINISSNNTGSNSLTFNSTTYTVTGANVNAGLPTDEFRDLDLSVNDIGNFGGSNSWENYWPTGVGNKPQVNYLNTPRRIFTGTTTMTAKASGYSK